MPNSDEMDSDFARIRTYLLEPIRAEIKAELIALRAELSAHGKRFDDYVTSQHSDHEARLRAMERNILPKWVWPAVAGICTGSSWVLTHLVK